MDADALLDGLDAGQRAAVLSTGAPLAILAGPGSGKTRVLTRRIAYRSATGAADARHVLALTFTRRAAAELVTRLRHAGLRDKMTVGTFHAVALGILRQRAADTGRRPPDIADRHRLVAAIVDSARRAGPTASDVTAEIDWARARLVAPEAYVRAAQAAGRRPAGGLGSMAELYHRYEDAKRKRHVRDLDDLLADVAELIERDPLFADVQRWRFRHLFVDEFQDVNPLQLQLLRAWLGDRADLCVVGDPDQSIYAWNGADPQALREIENTFPGATIVRLEQNHRSSASIVRAAASVLDEPGRGSAALDAVTTNPARHGPAPTVADYADEWAEAAGIARWLDDARPPGVSWGQCAVLVRTNAQVPVVVDGLARAGIGSRARRSGLVDDPEVRAAFNGAPAPDAPFGVRDWLSSLDDDDGGGDGGDSGPPARPPALVAVVDAARRLLLDDAAASMRTLRTHLDGERAGANTVDVVTFHAAKGLEWPVVVVAGCEAGLVPHASATTAAARDEETRLLYVAMTRAGERLLLTWATTRTLAGVRHDRQRSPLLERIDLGEQEEPACAVPPSVAPWRGAPDDGGVSKRLRALERWRSSAARVAQVAPAMVLADRALASIAAAAPRTHDDLAAIAGVGPLAARRYGQRILDTINALD